MIWLVESDARANAPAYKQATVEAFRDTPLRTIHQMEFYTGGPRAFVFIGDDSHGMKMVAWESTYGGGYEYFSRGVRQSQIQKNAFSLAGIQHIIHIMPGPVDNDVHTQFTNGASGSLVWEVYGTDRQGRGVFAYFDFYTGGLLWKYTLTQ